MSHPIYLCLQPSLYQSTPQPPAYYVNQNSPDKNYISLENNTHVQNPPKKVEIEEEEKMKRKQNR